MKTSAAGILLSTVCAATLSAPAIGSPWSEFGVVVGLTSSTIDGADSYITNYERGPLLGVMLGGTGTYDLEGPLAARLDVYYTQKGAEYTSDDHSSIMSMSYVQEDLLAAYDIQVTRKTYASVFAGPYLAFNMDAKTKTTQFSNRQTSTVAMASVEFIDYGLVVGGGITIRNRIGLDARLSSGLTSFDKNWSTSGVHHLDLLVSTRLLF